MQYNVPPENVRVLHDVFEDLRRIRYVVPYFSVVRRFLRMRAKTLWETAPNIYQLLNYGKSIGVDRLENEFPIFLSPGVEWKCFGERFRFSEDAAVSNHRQSSENLTWKQSSYNLTERDWKASHSRSRRLSPNDRDTEQQNGDR